MTFVFTFVQYIYMDGNGGGTGSDKGLIGGLQLCGSYICRRHCTGAGFESKAADYVGDG